MLGNLEGIENELSVPDKERALQVAIWPHCEAGIFRRN